MRGQRLLASVPHGHWKTTMFLAALRTTGLTAPLVVDGALNGELFLGWIIHHLVPTLQWGDIVVMDNLGAHKVAGVREAITAAGARLVYLPPYRLVGRATKVPSLVLGCEASNPSVHENYSMLYSSHISWSSPTTPTGGRSTSSSSRCRAWNHGSPAPAGGTSCWAGDRRWRSRAGSGRPLGSRRTAPSTCG